MRSTIRILAAALFALAGGAALAAMDQAKVAAAKAAADEFLALPKGANGGMPRQSDPKAKALLDKVFDRSALGREVLPIGESGKVGELLNNANRVGFAYMLAGTGQSDLGKIAEDPKAMELAEKNMSTYAPELGRWFDYQMIIQGSIADSTNAFLASAKKDVLERPQVKDGLGNIRQGLARSLGGMFQTMAGDGLDDGWRRERMVALAEIAPKAAKLLAPDDARTLRQQANALADALTDPALKAELKKFGDTIVAAAKP